MTCYAVGVGACICCGRVFSFNPQRVPSTEVSTGHREPICPTCFERINRRRVAAGLAAFEIAPDAYEPVEASEL